MKKAFKIAAALGVTAAAAWCAIDKNFKKAALEKPVKKSRSKKIRLPVEKELDEVAASVADLTERLKNLPLERLEITSRDGLKLVGHLYMPEEPERIIVAVHGWNSRWYRDFSAAALFWEEEGCAVLYIEQRAHGESEGRYRGFGIPESEDVLLWAKEAARLTGGDLPVYLSGISMGATTVMMASDLDLPEQVRGITADCGFTSPDGIWEHVMNENLHLPYGLFGKSIRKEYEKKLGVHPLSKTAPDALHSAKVPVLFFHGDADTFVPVSMTYENHEACASPKTLLIVPGAGHGAAFLKEPEIYKETVRRFWAECEK